MELFPAGAPFIAMWSEDLQKTTLTDICMIRGLDVAVGVPKALRPTTWGTKHCGTPVPQSATLLETANCCARTPVTFTRLKTLNASQLNSSRSRPFFRGTVRVTRRSSETALGKVKVLRPSPGVRSVARLPSLFRSKLRTALYGCPDWAVRMPLRCQSLKIMRGTDGKRRV